jgi:hypothetical protein
MNKSSTWSVIAGLIAPLAGGLSTGACSGKPADGKLQPIAIECGESLELCSGVCIDLQGDRENCGACGKKCGAGIACVKGKCSLTCTGGLKACGSACVDVQNDPQHCSDCGKACMPPANSAPVCIAAKCGSVCTTGFDDCNGKPEDGCEATLASDLANCGACNKKCAKPAKGTAGCMAGKCGIASCETGFDDCDKDLANGCEATLAGDNKNCGMCGKQCGATQLCLSGTCQDAAPSCSAIKQGNPGATDGIYTLKPDGPMGPNPPFKTFCDMTTENGAGWTLVLNRIVNSDNTGQPDLSPGNGAFDDTRATNFHFDINLFWPNTKYVVFAAKENNNCPSCNIGKYDSAVRLDRPNFPAWSKQCAGTSTPVAAVKLVGPSANSGGTGYMCAATLGWGQCPGNFVCHYGSNYTNTASDGSWSANQIFELHFPALYSSYAKYGDAINGPDGNANCRSCAGGLPSVLNQSSTCCSGSFNAKSRWTIWVR